MRLKNNFSKQTFGYNKEYHAKVEHYLTNIKRDKEIADALLSADKLCCKMEDDIVELEKSKKKQETNKYRCLTDFLSDIRENVCLYMAIYFPKLNYVDNLIDQYKEESQTKEEYSLAKKWREDIVESLIPLSGRDIPKVPQMEIKTSPEKKTEAPEQETQDMSFDDAYKIIKEAQRRQSEQNLESLLTKFTPTYSSPRGFDDVVGMDDIKLKLKEQIINYIENPLLITLDEEEYGISTPKGFLFYGPPGCGKTMITQALAAESGLAMYKMDISKYINESANNVEKAFEQLKKEVELSGKPCILFMDEMDSIAIKRDSFSNSPDNVKVTTTLLKHIDSAKDNGIIVIGATNKYDMLDEAIKSRFDEQLYVGLPDKNQIIALLKANLANRARGFMLANQDEEIEKLANDLVGYSNRSITFIINEAAKIARRDIRKNISIEHLQEAIKKANFEKSNESDYNPKVKTNKPKIGFH